MGTAQHGDLVPQHEQLRVLGGCRPPGQDQPAAEPDEDEAEQAQTRTIMMPSADARQRCRSGARHSFGTAQVTEGSADDHKVYPR